MASKRFLSIGVPTLAAAIAFAPLAFAQTSNTPSDTSAPAASSSTTSEGSTSESATTGNSSANKASQDVKEGAHRAAAGAKHVYHRAKSEVKDATLKARVMTALHENKATHDADDIHVSSDNGTITLSGTVPSKGMAERAHQIADEVVGVKQVRNELKYTSTAEEPSAGANGNVRN